MKNCLRYLSFLLLGLCASADFAGTGTTPAPGAGKGTNAVPQIPRSVFTLPSNKNEGKDPFFPSSGRVYVRVGPRPTNTDTPAPPKLILQGLDGPPHRMAVINGHPFAPGEEGEVKQSDGSRVLIKCLEITDESAVVEVRGDRLVLRMRGT